MANLIGKYRLLWDVSTLYIQNDYEKDWSGTITTIISAGDVDFMETDTYQDITDKISQEGLKIDPSLG